MFKISKYLSFFILVLSITACSNNNNIAGTGIAVEVSREQRHKVSPVQTVIAKSEILLAPVYFEFDKADLSQDAKNILLQNIQAVKNAKQVAVIGGHDSRGTERHNKTLAQKRADAVKDFYILQGANPALISTFINNKRPDICSAKDDEACHAQNRKADTVAILI
jgi:peptidoglycan-associated lipoprotein